MIKHDHVRAFCCRQSRIASACALHTWHDIQTGKYLQLVPGAQAARWSAAPAESASGRQIQWHQAAAPSVTVEAWSHIIRIGTSCIPIISRRNFRGPHKLCWKLRPVELEVAFAIDVQLPGQLAHPHTSFPPKIITAVVIAFTRPLFRHVREVLIHAAPTTPAVMKEEQRLTL